jgi:hypothetical protein
MKTALVLTAATAILSAGLATDALADSVKLHGATTVVNVVVTPNARPSRSRPDTPWKSSATPPGKASWI